MDGRARLGWCLARSWKTWCRHADAPISWSHHRYLTSQQSLVGLHSSGVHFTLFCGSSASGSTARKIVTSTLRSSSRCFLMPVSLVAPHMSPVASNSARLVSDVLHLPRSSIRSCLSIPGAIPFLFSIISISCRRHAITCLSTFPPFLSIYLYRLLLLLLFSILFVRPSSACW